MEKQHFNYGAWTKGRFSEAVTVTGPGKMIFLAGIGAEHEDTGEIQHMGDFDGQCRYAYEKLAKVLARNGASLKDVVKQVTYVTDVRYLKQTSERRSEAYGGIKSQLEEMQLNQRSLTQETQNLVKALRRPEVRGRWGEVQLRRVVEIAGMLPYCDFVEQESVDSENGRLRPDMIIKLPGGKEVVVDAKAPLQAFLEAWEAESEEARRTRLETVRGVRAALPVPLSVGGTR